MIYPKILLLLSTLDALITDIGVRERYITEDNPFAGFLYHENLLLFYGWKIAFPLLLIIIYPKVKNKKVVSKGIMIACLIYMGLSVYHGYWLSLVI